MRLATIIGTALSVLVGIAQTVRACSVAAPISPTEMIRRADAIVRVLAKDYVTPPANLTTWARGQPDSTIDFEILEVIRGQGLSDHILLHGYLSNQDDFNDHASPYSFVRPNGRAGSCFANTYRRGAQFVLVLKKGTDGVYTVNWYALGPVNEQLRSEDDPWLLWVRQESHRAGPAGGNPTADPMRRTNRSLPRDVLTAQTLLPLSAGPAGGSENDAIPYTGPRERSVTPLANPVVQCPTCRVSMVWTRYATHALVYVCPRCGHALISPLPAANAQTSAKQSD